MAAILKVGAVALGILLSASALATPFTLTAQLLGDPRFPEPDNLIIDVTVTGDTTLNIVNWTVDINSPLHPNAKLDEFYFNLSLGMGQVVTFSGFDPADWNWASPASVQGAGAGQNSFLFEVLDPNGQPNAEDVTNTQLLTFQMTLFGPVGFDPSIITGAGEFCSNDDDLGCGQLGAHLQSLVPVVQGTDSGFLLGQWEDGGGGQETPEPGSLALLGAALLGLLAITRRRKI